MSGLPNPTPVRVEKISPQLTEVSQVQNKTFVSRLGVQYTRPTHNFIATPPRDSVVSPGSIVVIRPIGNTSNPVNVTSAASSTGLKITPIVPLKISTIQSTSSASRPNSIPAQLQNATVPSLARVSSLITHSARPQSVQSGSTTADGLSGKSKTVDEKQTPQRNVIREMQVRVPNKKDKRFSVLRFHTADKLDLSSAPEVFMQRENNLKAYRSLYGTTEMPDTGAGSEFGREAKEEARLKKFGVVRESYKPDDQPWLMTVGKGKASRRRFRGVREGSVSENVEYFVFCQCKDGNFDAYPVNAWYKMKPEISYRFLREDEAEAEYSRLHKTLNLFNVMVKRKLTDNVSEDESNMDREISKGLKFLSSLGDRNSNQKNVTELQTNDLKTETSLKLTDLEELDSGSEADDDDDEDDLDDDTHSKNSNADLPKTEDGPSSSKGKSLLEDPDDRSKVGSKGGLLKASERSRLAKKKQRAAAIVTKMRRGVKRRKRKTVNMDSSDEEDDPDEEAQDESELDDHEGDEVDYMTNSSSDEEKLSSEEREKIYEETGVDEEVALKTLLTDISSDEEEKSEGDTQDIEENPLDDDEEDNAYTSKRRGETDDVKQSQGNDFQKGTKHAIHKSEDDRLEATAKSHRIHKKRQGSDNNDSGSSSSSSSDEDSSTYSSSDSDLDNRLKSIQKNAKKAEVMQKLSDTVHHSASLTSGVSCGSSDNQPINSGINSNLKRLTSDLTAPVNPTDITDSPAAKKSRSDISPSSVTPASSTDSELVNTVRKYLMRKPITVRELLKKIRLRKLVGKNEDAQTVLANVLRQLRPIKQTINGQHALSLKH
ncbi:General transcription factor IIF subunit 1 isoform 2 [Schistosoma japonicum]|uniref:General transcription factor IIF subunit 1 n=3 Tax=Schistosoma japonicum TaxID=6182 RepID=A0A4Z2CZT5_SCHJA|nr:General transcription factor IIF subunit 1 isoform 2 [Schistosoma japonicum]